MEKNIFFYLENDFLAQGLVNKNYDFITAVQAAVPSGLPYLILSKEDLLIDDIFFDCGILDFTKPDGYGYGRIAYNDLIEFKKKNKISDIEVQNEINKEKDRKIKLDINKAKIIWQNKLREERKPLLERLDIQYMRALEYGATELIQKIVKKKEFLRNITDDERLQNAKTREDLLQVYIPPNIIEE